MEWIFELVVGVSSAFVLWFQFKTICTLHVKFKGCYAIIEADINDDDDKRRGEGIILALSLCMSVID